MVFRVLSKPNGCESQSQERKTRSFLESFLAISFRFLIAQITSTSVEFAIVLAMSVLVAILKSKSPPLTNIFFAKVSAVRSVCRQTLALFRKTHSLAKTITDKVLKILGTMARFETFTVNIIFVTCFGAYRGVVNKSVQKSRTLERSSELGKQFRSVLVKFASRTETFLNS